MKENEGKESANMLALNKPRQATVISKGKTEEFIDVLLKNKTTNEYWNKCSDSKVDSSTMDKIKRMCTGK